MLQLQLCIGLGQNTAAREHLQIGENTMHVSTLTNSGVDKLISMHVVISESYRSGSGMRRGIPFPCVNNLRH